MTYNQLATVLRFWLPPVAWMALISPFNPLLTSGSTSSFLMPLLQWLFPYAGQSAIEALHFLIRKLSHFLEYAVLALLLLRAFRGCNKGEFRSGWIVYAGVIAVCYSIFDEYIQSFIPSRTGSFYDWLIDSAGVVCALGIMRVIGIGRRV